MRILSKFINSITEDSDGNLTFFGDGCGDFENVAKHASDVCVDNYIEYCREQIKLAEKYKGDIQ